MRFLCAFASEVQAVRCELDAKNRMLVDVDGEVGYSQNELDANIGHLNMGKQMLEAKKAVSTANGRNYGHVELEMARA